MTQENFTIIKDLLSKRYAELMFCYFEEYEWDKFIVVGDHSRMFGSTRNRFELYKNGIKITPYENEKGESKPYPEKANQITNKYAEFNLPDWKLFQEECLKSETTRWNIWEFTLYPSGEYKSSFIWDEQAVQDVLISIIKMSFTTLYTNAIYKINEVFLPKKEWQTATLVVEFVEGKIQPLKISIPFEGKILDFSVGIENIERTKKDTNISDYERDYALSNQENIKDKLYGSWTKVRMILHQNIFGGKFNPENYIFE